MNLDDQVISLSMAKKIDKVIARSSALFYWMRRKELTDEDANLMYVNEFAELDEGVVDIQRDYHVFPAYSVAELLTMLPPFIKVKGQEPFDCYTFNLKKISAKHIQYIVNYDCDTMQPDIESIPRKLWPHNICGEHLADVLAETLIRINALQKVLNQPKFTGEKQWQ